MKLYKLFTPLLFVVIFSACKKSDTPFVPVVPAPPVVTATNPSSAQTFLSVRYGSVNAQNMDVYLPAGRSTATTKVLIMIHGGSWTAGDKADLTPFVDTFKTRFPDYAIFNINYRLCNFVSLYFPTQEMDVKAAVEYINKYAPQYFISNKFVLMGASAGAHLAMLQAYKYHSPVNVKAVVDFFGPTDMKDMYDNPPSSLPPASIALLVGGNLSATPSVKPMAYLQSSPLYYANTQSCPTIIIQGGTDPLVNHLRQSEAMRDKLTLNSIPNEYVYFPSGDHGMNWTPSDWNHSFNRAQLFLTTHVL